MSSGYSRIRDAEFSCGTAVVGVRCPWGGVGHPTWNSWLGTQVPIIKFMISQWYFSQEVGGSQRHELGFTAYRYLALCGCWSLHLLWESGAPLAKLLWRVKEVIHLGLSVFRLQGGGSRNFTESNPFSCLWVHQANQNENLSISFLPMCPFNIILHGSSGSFCKHFLISLWEQLCDVLRWRY